MEVQQFVYPAVFVKGESQVAVSFPDLNITTEGESFEEAFLFAKDFLRIYCTYALKFDLEQIQPSFFENIVKSNPLENVMLLDTIIFPKDLK